MRALACLRVSTDDQAEAGNGLNAQLDSCRQWCAREGREFVGPFLDEGISGAAPLDKRPGLLDALGQLGAGDVLLVAKRDRLGRDPLVVAMIEAGAARKGARVVSAAGEGTDNDDPTNVLMRRIVDAFAEYERLVIKARTKAALGAKRRRGERTGAVPLGYVVTDDGRRSKKGRPLALAEVPAELAALATIRGLRAEGLGPRAIAREMTARKVPTKTGRRVWSESTVRGILARPEGPRPALPATTAPVVHPPAPPVPPPHFTRSMQHGDDSPAVPATADPDDVLR